MFFPEIYGGWEGVQREKYESIFGAIGGEFLSRLFRRKTLDIGCGRGFLKKFLEERGIEANMYGADIEPGGDVMADGDCLPFKNEAFDFVVSIDTMHLLAGDDFRRVLKKRGFALLGVFFNNDNFQERRGMLRHKLLLDDINFKTLL
ncbi:MAG: methyltransferase domain-containing protein [Candidatus Aenigmarchaeota archaeon]|nr:methyltransferase domain-containing protein [Candidatus Aenigmarchaeota archaeon]